MRSRAVGPFGQRGGVLRLLALCGALLLARSATAQVGHDPARSPYRTLRYSQYLGVTTGFFNGDGASLGVAPHHGPSVSLRYDFLANGTVTVGFAGTYASLYRL